MEAQKTSPWGTVWVAWGDNADIKARKFVMPLGRKLFQQMVCARALDLVRRRLLNVEEKSDFKK